MELKSIPNSMDKEGFAHSYCNTQEILSPILKRVETREDFQIIAKVGECMENCLE